MRVIHGATLGVLLMWVVAADLNGQQPGGTTILHAGRLLDVKTGTVLREQVIVIRDGRIVSVGAGSASTGSPGSTIINLPNATALPGLIDVHTRLTREIFERVASEFLLAPTTP